MMTPEQLRRQRLATRNRTRRWRARLAEKRLCDNRRIDRAIVDATSDELRKRAVSDLEATSDLFVAIGRNAWRRLRSTGVSAVDVDLDAAIKRRLIGQS
jgi:hypothetical protein